MAWRAAPLMSTDAVHRPPFHLRVETEAGPGGEELPRRFYLRERPVEVTEVVDRWPGRDRSDRRYFKVRGDDGDLYILRHDPLDGHWELTLFTSGDAPSVD